MKRLVFVLIALSLLLPFQVYSEPSYGEISDKNYPSLSVVKWIDQDQIILGDTISVTVNITNFSNSYAYNISIQEPTFQSNIMNDSRNHTTYTWFEIGFGGSISYSYDITPSVIGQFTLEPTTISYYDANNTIYKSQSAYLPFEVNTEAPPELDSEIWRNILIMVSIFVAIPIALFTILSYQKR